MFTQQEAAQLRQQFWTSFGQYMAPILSAEGVKINWINYKTGIKDVYFKMQADNASAVVSIVMGHADIARQTVVFDQFMQIKKQLQEAVQEEWEWVLQVTDENNKITSRIFTSLDGISIFKKQDWPAIISFFKPRMIALDLFWTEVKFVFENL